MEGPSGSSLIINFKPPVWHCNIRNIMDLRIISEIGTTEPVTLAEAKLYQDISHNQHDDFITGTIEVARKRAERYLNSDIVAKQRRMYLSSVDQPINLPYAPIASVDTVLINGQTQTVNEGYFVRGLDNPLIEFDNNTERFADDLRSVFSAARRVDITYSTSGIDADEIKNGVLALIAELYYGRTQPIKTNWRAFLSPFKIFGYYGTR